MPGGFNEDEDSSALCRGNNTLAIFWTSPAPFQGIGLVRALPKPRLAGQSTRAMAGVWL